jgi:hypothetical protein
MFVVWRRTERRGRLYLGDPAARLEARLVESLRIDGKPRQRFIAYIGSIEEPNDGGDRIDFWDVTSRVLNYLVNRLGDERPKIEAALDARVPRPTAQDRRAYMPRWERLKKRRGEACAQVRAERAAAPARPPDNVIPPKRRKRSRYAASFR